MKNADFLKTKVGVSCNLFETLNFCADGRQ